MVRTPKSLVKRTRSRMEARKVEGEQGSLILDILIGMAIFALIAIIAVSAIGQYRERAYVQGATSDANAVGLALEAQFTDDFAYPAATAVNGQATGLGDVVLTENNTVVGYSVDTDGESFSLCIEHDTSGAKNAWAVYNSADGGLVDSGRGEGCDAAEAVTALG